MSLERGERGPRGDHGQQGERGPVNRLGLIGFLILSAFVLFALFRQHQHDTKICNFAVDNREVLRLLIANGDPMKLENGKLVLRLKPGQPGYEYYSTRPAEARAAHFRNQAVLMKDVPPITC